MSNTRDFLRSIRPPYFDAFYFVDESTENFTRIVPHVFFKIIFFLEGDISYTIQDQQYNLQPSDILITPRYTPYYCHSLSQQTYRRLVIWFTPELLESIDPTGKLKEFFEGIDASRKGALFHFAHNHSDTIFNTVFHLVSERDYTKPFGDMVAHSLASLVLVEIYRTATSSRNKEAEDPDNNLLVDAVVSYINSNLQNDLSLDMIAEKFFISKFHLERTFKKKMNITVHNYIIQRRLSLAKQKLYDGDSPTRIYKMCGFTNYSTFYRAFQKMYNTTPRQFSEQATSMLYKGNRAWNAWSSAEEKDP